MQIYVFTLQIYTTGLNRRQPDASLENYVTSTIMNVIANFFTSPFSQCSTAIDVSKLFAGIEALKYNDFLINFVVDDEASK